MKKTSYRLNSARLIVALLGLGGLSACNSCSQSEVNQARDIVTDVLDRFDRLDSICADDAQVTEVDGGRNLKFTPVLRNDREETSGGLRLLMTISHPDHSGGTPGAFVQLAPATRHPRGTYAVEDPRASVTVPAAPGTTYFARTVVWAPLYPVPADEDLNRACHIRQSEHPRPGQ